MGKQYQTRDAEASTLGLAIPEEVLVALAEIAESAKEGLLALAVGAGLQVLGTLMEESVVALAGPRAGTTRTGPRCATATSRAR
jgi:putative transposase